MFNEPRPMQLPKQAKEVKAKEDMMMPMVMALTAAEEVSTEASKEEAPGQEAPTQKTDDMPESSSSQDAVESSVATRSSPMEEAIALEDVEEMVDFEPSPSREEADIGSSVEE